MKTIKNEKFPWTSEAFFQLKEDLNGNSDYEKGIIDALDLVNERLILPSRCQVNDKVRVFLMPEGENTFPGFTGIVKSVHFYNGKVKYDIELTFYGDFSSRIYNVDSVLVEPYTKSPTTV